MAILIMKRDHARVARIGKDGLTEDGAKLVPVSDVLDIQPIERPRADPDAPIDAEVGAKGVLTIPVAQRRRYGMQDGSRVLIEPRPDGLFIRPAEVRPRPVGPIPNLEDFLDGVTVENLHAEVDTGPAVGRELA